MPSKRKPARGDRRSATAAGIVIVLIAATIGYLALRPSPQTVPRPTACVAGPGGHGLQLTVGQAAIAATIAGVASQRHMPPRAVAIAYATALQESKLANLHYGDRDSVGVFQQRPSEGWGTTRQIEDPVYATSRFFEALAAVPHYLRIPIYAAAQAVQHSADGSAYAQYAGMGAELATAFTGTEPRAVWCIYGSAPGKARLAAASQDAGQRVRAVVAARQRRSGRDRQRAGFPAGLGGGIVAGVERSVATALLLSGIGGYEWFGFRGSGHWTAAPARSLARAAPSAVVFG